MQLSTVFSEQDLLFSIQTIYSYHCKGKILNFTDYCIKGRVNSLQFAMNNLKFTWFVQYTLYTVQCIVSDV